MNAELPLNHFVRGAQASREMLARFVEQGGDAATAASIRANWNAGWGDDPGRPEEVVATWEPEPCPEGEKLYAKLVRGDPDSSALGSLAELRLVARMLETWGPIVEPASSEGQVSFTRSLIVSAAEVIRALLRTRRKQRRS